MTYSETREMYTFFYVREENERRKRNARLLNALKLLYSWLFPWAVTSLSIIKVNSLSSMKSFLLSFVILTLSFLFSSSNMKKNRMYALFSLFFSYLMALSSFLSLLL